MIETNSVSLSGTALSLLIYENLKNPLGQEGFLLGQVVEHKSSTITDNDQRQVRVKRTLKINSCVPCPQKGYFYNNIGQVDKKKVRNFLGDLMPKVIAWYKFKPMSGINLTFRERIVHSQLSNMFEVPPEYFTYCLSISESSDDQSTHSFHQSFVRYNRDNYERLPLHIGNLSDKNNTYKSPEPVSDSFKSLLSGLKINHKNTQGLTIVTKIQSALEKRTDHVVQELAEAEKQLAQLENDIQQMLEKHRKKQMLLLTNSIGNHTGCTVVENKDFSLPDYDDRPEKTICETSKTIEESSIKRENFNNRLNRSESVSSDSEAHTQRSEDNSSPILGSDTSNSSSRNVRGKSNQIRGRRRDMNSSIKRNSTEVTAQTTTNRLRKKD